MKKIKFLFVSKEEVVRNKEMLDERWKTVKSIPKLQSNHFFMLGGLQNQ